MQKGKTTILNVIVLCVLVLSAMMAFKFISSGIEKKEVKKEVFDTMGNFRGSQLNDAKIEEIVVQVLGKRSLQPLEVSSNISTQGKVTFSFKYEKTVNYILFKSTEIIEIEGELDNYGG